MLLYYLLCGGCYTLLYNRLFLSSYILRPVTVFLGRCVFISSGFHRITVKGRLAAPSEASILVMAPHSSYFDALPVVFLNLTSVVAKIENGCLPIFGSTDIYAFRL